MTVLEIAIVLIALFGHAVVWLGINNRLHAMPLKRSHLKAISGLSHLGTVAVPIAFAWWLYRENLPPGEWHLAIDNHPTILAYVLFCVGMAAVHLPRWLYIRFVRLKQAWRIGKKLFVLDVVERLGRHPTHGIHFAIGRRIPFNEVMQVEFSQKSVPISGLPRSLEGLRIVHLSDLHFSGRVEPAFFHEVIREVNALEPDLVLLTGDVCDKAKCLPWIGEVLSPLRSRYGRYFILGNHDDRLQNVSALRAAIQSAGLIDLGGRWKTLTIQGEELLLAGNERPWFRPAPLDEERSGVTSPQKRTGILLSHSPDQVRWARERNFDLMLCGHTHGGQIRFPVIGPVVCPSWYGVRYASGLFLEGSLAIHVTRGVSGLFSIRWNCMPEVALLVLECSTSRTQ